MCGRFTLLLGWREIFDLLDGFLNSLNLTAAAEIENAPPRYNIAPTQPILLIKRAGGQIKPELMRWGLVPEWVDDPASFPLIINARAETIAEKASFKSALKNSRCIIPVSGYYEWQKNEQGQNKPVYIFRADREPFLLAGLYATWVGPDGEEVDTAAIITVPAGEDLSHIHARTPAVLSHDSSRLWLDTANINAEKSRKLLRTMPKGLAQFHFVSTQVNSPKNDNPQLIVPVTEEIKAGPSAETNTDAKSKPTSKNSSDQLDLF